MKTKMVEDLESAGPICIKLLKNLYQNMQTNPSLPYQTLPHLRIILIKLLITHSTLHNTSHNIISCIATPRLFD